MQHVSGLIPTDQEVVRPHPYPYWYRPATNARQRSTRKGLFAGALLVLAFLLLLLGAGMGGPGQVTTSRQMAAESLLHVPIASVAAMVGCSPVEAVQLLWNSGIHITASRQTLSDIAEENGRESTEILAILSGRDRVVATMVN